MNRRKVLLLSNALDAAARGVADYVIGVVAVVVLGATALQMGALNFLGAAPFLILGIPVGVIVERASPRMVLMLGSAARALLLLLISSAIFGAVPSFALVAAGYFMIGICTVVAETAQATYAVEISGQDQVGTTFSSLQAVDAAAGLIIPATCGALIAVVDAPVMLVAAGSLSLGSALVLASRRRGRRPAGSGAVRRGQARPPVRAGLRVSTGKFFREALEGARIVAATPLLARLSIASVCTSLGLAAFSAVETILLLRDLAISPTEFGIVLSSAAAGGLAGSLVSQPLARSISRLGMVKTSYVLLIPAAAAMYLLTLPDAPVLLILVVQALIWGTVMVANSVQVSALVAENVPSGFIARVTAVRRTLSMGSIPLGSLLGGILGSGTGPWGVLLVWVLLVLTAAFVVVSIPRSAVVATPQPTYT